MRLWYSYYDSLYGLLLLNLIKLGKVLGMMLLFKALVSRGISISQVIQSVRMVATAKTIRASVQHIFMALHVKKVRSEALVTYICT